MQVFVADALTPAPQHDTLGGTGTGVGRQSRTHAVLVVLTVARVVFAPLVVFSGIHSQVAPGKRRLRPLQQGTPVLSIIGALNVEGTGVV